MATKKAAAPREIYQIKVTLLGTRPPIWRRLLLPSAMTLAQLHDVLQVSMGWQDSHLHQFSEGSRRIGQPNAEQEEMGMSPVEDERKVRLSTLLGKVGAKAMYTYDFGDGWDHNILLEKRLPPDPEMQYPRCTGGKLACPPEDCGGVPGFYNFLHAINDPSHEEHEELLEWIGGSFDDEAFSADDVNRMLAPLPDASLQPRPGDLE